MSAAMLKVAEMNGVQRKNPQNIEKFPGCLGRMVNLFDLSTGIPANRMITERPHRDGSSLSRCQSDVYSMLTPAFEEKSEEQMIVSDLRRTSSNKNVGGTPIKTLIDQEMAKELECKHNPPNLVAKLMGLDSLPRQQPSFVSRQGHSRVSAGHSSNPSWEQDQDLLNKGLGCEIRSSLELNEYKDVYEIWQDSEHRKHMYGKTSLTHKGGSHGNLNEKKLALVRQKFMEAKRLVTDEKLRQSKEFQDAMEVLSSNRDIFLKFLEGPNPIYSQHLCDLQSMARPHETKRITVLKPSKTLDGSKFAGMDKSGGNQTKRLTEMSQATGWDRNGTVCSPLSGQKVDAYPAQPTRIVVLKPSTGKAQESKTLISPSPSSPSMLHGGSFYEEPEGEDDDDDVRESREVAKMITQRMQENLVGHRRDETLLSSVFSNGYIGDDSSFNKSENDYAMGNLSDSEVMSPTSRHSWDYINRAGSPYSSSSFSRASCSPESSVCREAKKRLSERWAMMASNGSSQEQRHVRRSSSTLGEMLALYDTKMSMRTEDGVNNKENEPRGSTSCIDGNLDKDEGVDASPKNLLRSKSVPVSFTVYGARLDVEVCQFEGGKAEVRKELSKAKSMKSSLRGKVSSLFFSKSKKQTKERSSESETTNAQLATPEAPRSPVVPSQKSITDATQSASDIEECSSPGIFGSPSKTPFGCLDCAGAKPGLISQEGGLSLSKPIIPVGENQDQPSPISVLEPPFEEDDSTMPGKIKCQYQGINLLPKCNLIDKSPPIGSIARTLSWGDANIDTATSFTKHSGLSPCDREEEQDWVLFVQMLLSGAGLDGEVWSGSLMARWHSPESPLDPSLRDKYSDMNDKEPFHEAKRRQWRSSRKLVFDCVNMALVEISGYGAEHGISALSFPRVARRPGEGADGTLVDHVWAHMKDWFYSEAKWGNMGGEDGDSNSLVVESMVRKEVVGKGWIDRMKLEVDAMGKDIEGRLLEELVEEAVVDLTGRLLL